jgi:hypothetical protein
VAIFLIYENHVYAELVDGKARLRRLYWEDVPCTVPEVGSALDDRGGCRRLVQRR